MDLYYLKLTCNPPDNLISSVENEAADDERLWSKTLGTKKEPLIKWQGHIFCTAELIVFN